MEYTDITAYWFDDEIRKHWFSSTPELDRQIKEKYEHIWEGAAANEFDHWQDSPEGAVALIIVLDQFPLNMFRGQAKSFATERKAVEVSLNAVQRGFDDQLNKDRLVFLFMPLMHSENIEEQNLSVALYRKHELVDNLKFAEHHRDIIKKYGRFPHRNAILGRESTKEEKEYLLSDKAFKG